MTTQPSVDRALVAGFPFPFPTDRYRYSTNVEPAPRAVSTPAGQWGASLVDVDGEYHRELAERADVLERDPSRYAVLDHMAPACWDTMLTLMRELAAAYPDVMSLDGDGPSYVWTNRLLDVEQPFTYAQPSTLPDEPLRYVASQVQEDLVLLDQRDGDLWGDAGLVTFAADWSFGFDVGMTFLEIHGPVPRLRETGVITRAREFIMRLQPGAPYRRTNWTLTIGRQLDVSTERYPAWGPDRPRMLTVDDATFGREVHLRTEVQHLVRLEESGAVLFLIRTYLLPFEELARVEPWRATTAAVLADLPDDIADYKGIAGYRDRAVDWLHAHAP
ncbi:DUF3445 domain-containing protein [Aeromicrobium sp.]|uniref:heme-dependent oxidative N-demethylase family protein n=1 Tax=Aeromicrobium sp. TaxID=1871063 RepID=UPI003513A13B